MTQVSSTNNLNPDAESFRPANKKSDPPIIVAATTPIISSVKANDVIKGNKGHDEESEYSEYYDDEEGNHDATATEAAPNREGKYSSK